MPYASKAQRGYLHAKLPAVAARFDAETPKGARLPEHAKKKRKRLHELMRETYK